jgi:hypothetical protein
MILKKTINKQYLEKIIHEFFYNFGFISSSFLLDSIKLLGFYYATNSGLSLNIEDLKIIKLRKDLIKKIEKNVYKINKKWEEGLFSNSERFENILNIWNFSINTLKNKIIEYYRNFDPLNNSFLMSFSGARGNIDQTKQLIGLRGVMSDPVGNIIDLVIKKNFREGLNSIDYIISSYGSRKGIVDTALKTADSGYLTRRLIYLAQDVIIKEFDCLTNEGIILKNNIKLKLKFLLHKYINFIYILNNKKKIKIKYNKFLNIKLFQQLCLMKNLYYLNIRSIFVCKSKNSICQKCYGLNGFNKNLISLGENVGILAAQAVGEPGTQMTMRTFHIGGVYKGNKSKNIKALFSGFLKIPQNLNSKLIRTELGNNLYHLNKKIVLNLINWKNNIQKIYLTNNFNLYFNRSTFVKKGEIIAELMFNSQILIKKVLNILKTPINGQIFLASQNKNSKSEQTMLISEGDFLLVSKEIKLNYINNLNNYRPFGYYKLVSPYTGIIKLLANKILLFTKKNIYIYNLKFLLKNEKNYYKKLSILVKNNQYIQKNTIIGFFEIYLLNNFELKYIKKKTLQFNCLYFLIYKSKINEINSELPLDKNFNKLNIFKDKIKYNNFGILLSEYGSKKIYHKTYFIFLNPKINLFYKNNNFIFKNNILGNIITYSNQTEDIIQGLPKIEDIINVFNPIENQCILSKKSGIFISNYYKNYKFKNNIYNFKIINEKNNFTYLTNSFFLEKNILFFKNKLFLSYLLPLNYKPLKLNLYIFINELTKDFLKLSNNFSIIWKKVAIKNSFKFIFNKLIKNKKMNLKINKNTLLFVNKNGDFIIKIKNIYIYLKNINFIKKYNINFSKTTFKLGQFISVGEPLTEGLINFNNLLSILFNYHKNFDGFFNGIKKSLLKFQLILLNSLQLIFQAQNIFILNKHIEIIIRQMTEKVLILKSGSTPFLPEELIKLSLINEIEFLFLNKKKFVNPLYKPIMLSINMNVVNNSSFISSAGFQQSKKILTRASILGSFDWFDGIRECLTIGRISPSGSSYLNYKNYLDNIYNFKK